MAVCVHLSDQMISSSSDLSGSQRALNLLIRLKLEAIEHIDAQTQLVIERLVNLLIVNGDTFKPKFDKVFKHKLFKINSLILLYMYIHIKKELYEFNVTVRIVDLNKFEPEFVLPVVQFIVENGQATGAKQRVFTYKIVECQDFVLDTRAIDNDHSKRNEKLFYTLAYFNFKY